MLITREMDYSIRILRALHRASPLTSPRIAACEHLQPPVTYKLLKMLSVAGIVKGSRGAVGGYTLLIPCSELTLYDLFRATQNEPVLTECLHPDFLCENNSCGECRVHREFQRIQTVLEQELKRTRLTDLF